MPSLNGPAALRATLAPLAEIPEPEWQFFLRRIRERRYERGEHLFLEGSSTDAFHFIVSGLVRLYYIRDGRELIRGFDMNGQFVTAYESLLTGAPAPFSVQALEPTHTVCVSGSVLQQLYDRHPCWDRLGRRVLEIAWVRQTDKARRLRIHSAEEHYLELLRRDSPLLGRVPLKELASFLQVTPETLSRIRARRRVAQHPTTPGSIGA